MTDWTLTMEKNMIQRYLGPLIVTLAIIACVIFVSCVDEGEVVKDEPSALQQPSPGEPTLEPFTPQPSQPAEPQPQPGGQLAEPPAQQQPQPVEQQPQPQPEPPRVEQMPQPELEPPAALLGLPDDTAGYDRWLKLNAQPIPPVPGFDPHRGTKNVYVNKTREDIAPNGQQQFPYPDRGTAADHCSEWSAAVPLSGWRDCREGSGSSR